MSDPNHEAPESDPPPPQPVLSATEGQIQAPLPIANEFWPPHGLANPRWPTSWIRYVSTPQCNRLFAVSCRACSHDFAYVNGDLFYDTCAEDDYVYHFFPLSLRQDKIKFVETQESSLAGKEDISFYDMICTTCGPSMRIGGWATSEEGQGGKASLLLFNRKTILLEHVYWHKKVEIRPLSSLKMCEKLPLEAQRFLNLYSVSDNEPSSGNTPRPPFVEARSYCPSSERSTIINPVQEVSSTQMERIRGLPGQSTNSSLQKSADAERWFITDGGNSGVGGRDHDYAPEPVVLYEYEYAFAEVDEDYNEPPPAQRPYYATRNYEEARQSNTFYESDIAEPITDTNSWASSPPPAVPAVGKPDYTQYPDYKNIDKMLQGLRQESERTRRSWTRVKEIVCACELSLARLFEDQNLVYEQYEKDCSELRMENARLQECVRIYQQSEYEQLSRRLQSHADNQLRRSSSPTSEANNRRRKRTDSDPIIHESEIDEIIDYRRKEDGEQEYRATLTGYFPDWNQNPPWLPAAHFADCQQKIDEYHSSHQEVHIASDTAVEGEPRSMPTVRNKRRRLNPR